MTTPPRPWRQRETIAWTIVLTLSLAWLAFLLFQRGHPFDEAEHAHVGWLISQGKVPINDFFQHHLPLLWSLLALYFRVGLTGAGVLIWGRVLVILSGIVSLASLWLLARYPSDSRRLMGYLGCAFFIGLTGFIPELFVIRPETIAAGCFLLALLIWNHFDGWAQLALAGAFAGVAMYATPRFVLLGGFFFLLGKNHIRRWISLAAGALIFLGVYTKLSGFGIDKVIFSLRFSSYLQTVGDGAAGGRHESTWAGLMLITCLALAGLTTMIPKSDRFRAAALIGYSMLVFVACDHVTGLFRYAQAYAPFIVAVSIAAAWIGGRAEWAEERVPALVPVLIAMLLLPGLEMFRPTRPHFDFLASVRARNKLAEMVPAGGTVLVYTRDNPISIPDASYYGIPLADGKDRLCRAVNGFESGFHSRIKLPKCDLLNTLRNRKPYFVDGSIKDATGNAGQAEQIIEKDYRSVDIGSGYPGYIQSELERLDSAALAFQQKN
ncbi:MAG TPA: hypothetical protein VG322_10325 [Candidatus Acidoferrales bacterium]|nr:hypothetical protein [Candidatus Acidoferrales bacterium]